MFSDPRAMNGRSDRSTVIRCKCGSVLTTLSPGERVTTLEVGGARHVEIKCGCGRTRSLLVATDPGAGSTRSDAVASRGV